MTDNNNQNSEELKASLTSIPGGRVSGTEQALLKEKAAKEAALNLQQGMTPPGARIDMNSIITSLAVTLSSVQRDLSDQKKSHEQLAHMSMQLMTAFNQLVVQLQAQGVLPKAPPPPEQPQQNHGQPEVPNPAA